MTDAFRCWRLKGKDPELTRRLVAAVARVYGAHPLMRHLVVEHVLRPARAHPRDDAAKVRAIQEWVRDNIRFENESGEQVLTPGRVLIWRFGDCDDRAGLVVAMLESIRIPWRLELLSRKVGAQMVPFHIWPLALVDGRWVHLETSDSRARCGEHPADLMQRISGLSL